MADDERPTLTLNHRPNPYVGPRSFETGEAFYGRDRELRSLTALLIAERIVLLHSPSGAGKTSLMQAGLLPRLREEGFNVLPTIRVNQEPPEALVDTPDFNRYALSTVLSLEENLPDRQRLPLTELASMTLDEYLTSLPRGVKTVSATESQLDEGVDVSDVLIFDQFEEVLTIASTDRESKLAFFEQLGIALRNKNRWALFAIREDYLGALTSYTRPIPGRLTATFRLDLLGVSGALQAIRRPARVEKVQFAESAAQKLVDDLRRVQMQLPDGSMEEQLGPYIEPVQLQVVCYRLWQGLDEQHMEITDDDLATVGNVNQSLANYYANSVKRVAQKTNFDERLIREWFERKLITPEGIRGQVLMGTENSDGLPNILVRRLEDAHIIRGEKRASKTWYELSHDRMIRPVRDDNAAWFTTNLSLFQQQAALWVQQGKPEGLLLRGDEMDAAENDVKQLTLTADEQSFLDACRALRKREQKERQNKLLSIANIVAVVFLVIAIIFGVRATAATEEARQQAATAEVAKEQAETSGRAAATSQVKAEKNAAAAATAQKDAESQSNIARAGELSTLALIEKNKQKQPDLALLFALEGFYKYENTRTKGTLLTVTNAYNGLDLNVYGHDDDVRSIIFSQDGKQMISGSNDTTVIVWDTSNPTEPRIDARMRGHTSIVTSVSLRADNKLVASGGADKFVFLWDISDPTHPEQLVKITEHKDRVTGVAISPDGKLLVTSSYDKSIILWDITKPSEPVIVAKLLDHDQPVIAIAFNPFDGGKTLASTGSDERIFLWDVSNPTSPTVRATLTGYSEVINQIAFSPLGTRKMLATASNDRHVVLWDVSNPSAPTQIVTLLGHSAEVMAVTFSPDGKTLASGGLDTTVILWDITTPNMPVQISAIGRQAVQTSAVLSLAFDPLDDGKTLASGSRNDTIMFWNLHPEGWVQKACDLVKRNFSFLEWQQYFPNEAYRKTCEQWPLEQVPAAEESEK